MRGGANTHRPFQEVTNPYLSDYKNRLANGPQDKIELPREEEVLTKYILWLLRADVRQLTTCGQNHGFLFCKRDGSSFGNASEWTTYVSGLIEKRSGIPHVGPNALRHAFATFVESSNGEDHQRLRESASRAMRHTLRYVDRANGAPRLVLSNASPIPFV